MIWPFLFLAVAQSSDAESRPYNLGAPATAEGAKLTVARLFEATISKNDAGYDKVARGMVVMLAPDFAMPLDRAKFDEVFAGCAAPQVLSSRPFPKMPEAQAVRISMQCQDKDHPKAVDFVADIMADDEHTFMIFPGGVEDVWPKAGKP